MSVLSRGFTGVSITSKKGSAGVEEGQERLSFGERSRGEPTVVHSNEELL